MPYFSFNFFAKKLPKEMVEQRLMMLRVHLKGIVDAVSAKTTRYEFPA